METPRSSARYGLLRTPFEPPRTPEPFSATHDDIQPPSPPRQPKLRVKRRVGSNLSAPTHQFLASVAAADRTATTATAADVPIPSIEEPDCAPEDSEISIPKPLVLQLPQFDDMALSPQIRGRMFSPPKTPAPGTAPSLSPKRYPDWSMDSFSSCESSPECESSRPSTARSTVTSGSMFSSMSCMSDDNRFATPDVDFEPKGMDDCNESLAMKRAKRKMPWTKPMNNHLWAAYVQYVQDPTKTPIRMGKSCIPPQGVCSRVAREAKQSWRGARTSAKMQLPGDDKSGSTTPKANSSSTYMQWPHSTAATRAQLRELCKQQANSSGIRNRHFMSKSPTPFYQTSRKPAYSPTPFSSHEMNKSLIISTAESMKPDGPLAQLQEPSTSEPTATVQTPAVEPPAPPAPETPAAPVPVPEITTQAPVPAPTELTAAASLTPPATLEPPFLASPFGARSYGPSSSGSLAGITVAPTTSTTAQRHTVGGRRNTLQSPVRLSRPSTYQRRRTKHLSMDVRRGRPGLPSDIFKEPSPGARAPAVPTVPTIPDLTSSNNSPSSNTANLEDPFSPRSAEIASTIHSTRRARGHTVWAAPATASLAPPPMDPLPRLGSPFTTVPNNSRSVPNRFSLPNGMDADALRRPFATVQQPTDTHAPAAPPPRNLATRLAYIDQRLRELNSRENLCQQH